MVEERNLPKRIAVAPSLMILISVVSTRRRRKREAVHLHLRLIKEKEEEDEAERPLDHRSQIPALRIGALEAPVPRENQSRYAVRNGKPVVLANGEINANFGIPPTAGSLPKGAAKRVMRVRFLTEQARLLLPKRTNPRLDLL